MLAVADVIRPAVDDRLQVGADACHPRLDKGGAPCAACVKRGGTEKVSKRIGVEPELVRHGLEIGQPVADELQPASRVVGEPPVARDLAREQRSRVQHAYRIASRVR